MTTRYRWTPKDPPIAPELWSAIARANQAIVKRLRRERKPFEIVEVKPNRYQIRPL